MIYQPSLEEITMGEINGFIASAAIELDVDYVDFKDAIDATVGLMNKSALTQHERHIIAGLAAKGGVSLYIDCSLSGWSWTLRCSYSGNSGFSNSSHVFSVVIPEDEAKRQLASDKFDEKVREAKALYQDLLNQAKQGINVKFLYPKPAKKPVVRRKPKTEECDWPLPF